jgi:gluconolactonase
LADKYEGKRFNSPNDVIVGSDGAIYFTDPTLYLVKGEKQEISFQGVNRLDEKRAVRLVTRDLTQPNGPAFSPDGKQFYVDDSQEKNIRVIRRHAGWKSCKRPDSRGRKGGTA